MAKEKANEPQQAQKPKFVDPSTHSEQVDNLKGPPARKTSGDDPPVAGGFFKTRKEHDDHVREAEEKQQPPQPSDPKLPTD